MMIFLFSIFFRCFFFFDWNFSGVCFNLDFIGWVFLVFILCWIFLNSFKLKFFLEKMFWNFRRRYWIFWFCLEVRFFVDLFVRFIKWFGNLIGKCLFVLLWFCSFLLLVIWFILEIVLIIIFFWSLIGFVDKLCKRIGIWLLLLIKVCGESNFLILWYGLKIKVLVMCWFKWLRICIDENGLIFIFWFNFILVIWICLFFVFSRVVFICLLLRIICILLRLMVVFCVFRKFRFKMMGLDMLVIRVV